MRRRHQHGSRAGVGRDIERRLVEAEQELRAGARPDAQLVGIGRVDAGGDTLRGQRAYRVGEMRERRVRQAAEIDDVGAGRTHRARARQNIVDPEHRRFDNLGEDADIAARQIEPATAFAEISRQIVQFLRPALERHAEFNAQARKIGAATARYDDTRRLDRTRQPARDDRLRHQGRNLDADIDHRPAELGLAHAGEHLFEARLRQVSGQEGDALAHASSRLRRAIAALSSTSVSTTLTSPKVLSRAVFSRSIARG